MTITADEIRELLTKAEKATPGPWGFDSTKNEGAYGGGEDISEGFNSYAVHSESIDDFYSNPAVICDTLNSDVALLEEEYDDENSFSAWDEQGRRNMSYIAACSPDRISALGILALEAVRLREAVKPFSAAAKFYADDPTSENLDAVLKMLYPVDFLKLAALSSTEKVDG